MTKKSKRDWKASDYVSHYKKLMAQLKSEKTRLEMAGTLTPLIASLMQKTLEKHMAEHDSWYKIAVANKEIKAD